MNIEVYEPITDATIDLFRDLPENEPLNIYINSPGGSVFAATTICAILDRCKNEINTYVDGLAASAATFILFAGNMNVNPSSMVMIHKPSVTCQGNADELLESAATLDKIQSQMVDIYAKKCKCSEEELHALINAESWLDAKEFCELFECNMLNECKKIAALVDFSAFNYKNIPENLVQVEEVENEAEEAAVDLSDFLEMFEKFKK